MKVIVTLSADDAKRLEKAAKSAGKSAAEIVCFLLEAEVSKPDSAKNFFGVKVSKPRKEATDERA